VYKKEYISSVSETEDLNTEVESLMTSFFKEKNDGTSYRAEIDQIKEEIKILKEEFKVTNQEIEQMEKGKKADNRMILKYKTSSSLIKEKINNEVVF
jgi:peptidoglycan hydrolase CwlO-like protein